MTKYIQHIIFLICISVTTVHAQDLHFSQYFNAPLLVNPANTGFAPESDYRVGMNYRNQWASISNPYKTMSAWGDVQLFNNRFENGWIGLGASLLSDKAGTGSLTSNRGYISAAYHQMLGLGSLLSIGFNAGFNQKRIDFSKLSFDNQWNGKFFDITVPPNEPFAFNSVTYMSLGVGINYGYFVNENVYVNLGASVNNLNRPKESFFADSAAVDAEIAPRATGFLNASIKLNDRWILNPNIYYSRVGNAGELVAGINANRNLSGDGATQLILGLYYRGGDAAIPMVGFQWNNFKLTANYDATISSLSSFNRSQGAYEISLIKTGLFNPDKPVKCPTIKF